MKVLKNELFLIAVNLQQAPDDHVSSFPTSFACLLIETTQPV